MPLLLLPRCLRQSPQLAAPLLTFGGSNRLQTNVSNNVTTATLVLCNQCRKPRKPSLPISTADHSTRNVSTDRRPQFAIATREADFILALQSKPPNLQWPTSPHGERFLGQTNFRSSKVVSRSVLRASASSVTRLLRNKVARFCTTLTDYCRGKGGGDHPSAEKPPHSPSAKHETRECVGRTRAI